MTKSFWDVILASIILISWGNMIHAQTAINSDGTIPHPSTMLEVNSVTSGFLPTCLISDQINAIDAPAEGLIVFSLDDKCLILYEGTHDLITHASHTGMGSGEINTESIIIQCATPTSAADRCADLELNGFSDWYLPFKNEMNEFFVQKDLIGGFSTGAYWTSTQYNAQVAWERHFSMIAPDLKPKSQINTVRSIRKF